MLYYLNTRRYNCQEDILKKKNKTMNNKFPHQNPDPARSGVFNPTPACKSGFTQPQQAAGYFWCGNKAQIDYYEGLLVKHGENYLALDWNNPENQKLRFQIQKEIFVYGRKAFDISVLDLGCGFGDLYGFLKTEGLLSRHHIKYTGFDIFLNFVEIAKKKYPDARFELIDILEKEHLPKFDYIFCSGVFNIRTRDVEGHLEFVKTILQRTYDLAACGVSVNFLSEGELPVSNPEDLNSGRYYYFRPDEILNFCRSIGGRYILRHDYHPGDFTVYLLK
jgi:SAM-dependent methyltransferase